MNLWQTYESLYSAIDLIDTARLAKGISPQEFERLTAERERLRDQALSLSPRREPGSIDGVGGTEREETEDDNERE